MAINLSRSFAKPCDILCDLTVDDVAIPQASVGVNEVDRLVVMLFTGQQPSIKFNGQGYTVSLVTITAPSKHTIEDIRADAELTVIAENPKREMVAISVLLRTNTAASKLKSMVNSFVPYAVKGRSIEVKLGDAWSLTQMIPPDPAYYSYVGQLPFFGGLKCQWVVFRSMGNIDPNEFAQLTRLVGNVPPAKMLPRNQEVFFNDTQHISGVPDGKRYMRCRRIKRKGEDETAPRVTPAKGLEDAAKKKETAETQKPDYSGALGTLNYAWWWIKYYIGHVGVGSVLDAAIFLVSIIAGVYAAYQISQSDRGLTLARTAQNGARSVLRFWNAILDRIIALLPFTGGVLGLLKSSTV